MTKSIHFQITSKLTAIIFIVHRMEAPPLPACDCIVRPKMIKGWEGTAIVGHGALLRFGCLSYVFSIAEFDVPDDE